MANELEEFLREFQWVPTKLFELWVMGIKSKHEEHGWTSMPGILWDVDTMTFFGCCKTTMPMLKLANNSWRPSKRHEYQTYLASMVLAIECLGCDFAGWSARYPEAGKQAEQILNTYFINHRARLLDVYMPLRGQMDRDRLRLGLGPRE
jgi:hypothetical protein